MHIPQTMLQGSVCPITTAVIGAGVVVAAAVAVVISQRRERCNSLKFAQVTALVFAGQMLNFPVAGGTSGHFLGGVAAVMLLGFPEGILSLALTVTLQCLFFADGGVDMLGANVLNMAGIGAGAGGAALYLLRRLGEKYRYVAVFFAAWLSVVLAALAVSIELAASGVVPLGTVLPAMLGVHMLIGIGEGVITVAAAAFLPVGEAEKKSGRAVYVVSAMLVAAIVLAPFACGLPDGLEWVAEKLRFWKESAPAFVAPMPDYTIPALQTGLVSQWLAAAAGVALTFFAAYLLSCLLRRKESGN